MAAAPEAQAEDESVGAAVRPEGEVRGPQPSLSPPRRALDPGCMGTVTIICPLHRQGTGAQSWACTEVPAEEREAGFLQGPPLTLSSWVMMGLRQEWGSLTSETPPPRAEPLNWLQAPHRQM